MNIKSVLQSLNIHFVEQGQHRHASAGWIQVDCPWCSKDQKKFRLGINLSKGFCNCWSCGCKNLTNVLAVLGNIPYGEAKNRLHDVGWEVVQTTKKPNGKLVVPRGLQPLQSPHRKYLKSRGMNPDEIENLWGARGISISPKLSWRIWIPIHLHGEIVSWTTRTIGNCSPRYITASPQEEILSSKSTLYGIDYVRNSAIVVEGPLDVWAIGPGAIATLGMNYNQDQLLMLGSVPFRAICFDAEEDAQRRARGLAKKLQAFPGETIVVCLESGKDAAEADSEEVAQLRDRVLGK
jgi:DNA primase